MSDAYVFGETHGTKESPELFLRFVCSFIKSSRTPPIVGVEVSAASALAVKEGLRDGAIDNERKRQVFASSMFWRNSRDGRSSHAYYLLLTRLFALEKAGKVVVVGFDRRVTGKEPFGQTASDFILALRNAPPLPTRGAGNVKSTVIALTGNGHAKPDGSPLSLTDAFVRGGLATQVISVEHAGGTAWVCVQGMCGPTEFPARAACSHQELASMEPARLRDNEGGNGHVEAICIGPISSSPPEASFGGFD